MQHTCSLWYAWDRHHFPGLLTRPDLALFNRKILPSYMKIYMDESMLKNFGLILTTVVLLSVVLYTSPGTHLEGRGSHSLYLAGAVIAASHYLFDFGLLPNIRAIQANVGDQLVAGLQKLLRLHAFRTLPLELIACICCVAAVARTLSP
ncbi:hypothetical protein F4818DRAFT_421024 [Hypoxylon cercidicola]|nr:hypothetical protein F4818DRAFT_421024 [Hypoxylon cercidicola]